MGNLTVSKNYFDTCLYNLKRVLESCKGKWLVLNWKKCHFMTISKNVLGHVMSLRRIEVDKVKVEVISKLPSLKTTREVCSFFKICLVL